MSSRISKILADIRQLEEELEDAIGTHEARFFYRIEGTKVRFDRAVRDAQRKLKVGTLRWLRESNPRNVITAPVIYLMIVPFLLLDASITLYQAICFPLYRIPKVRRAKYIAMDRHSLSYLNGIEKVICIYCGYANGLIGYVREIAALTEQYWCPIKHAQKILDPHRRYARFADFGDSEGYQGHVDKMREQLAGKPKTTAAGTQG